MFQVNAHHETEKKPQLSCLMCVSVKLTENMRCDRNHTCIWI